jgi:hypothetical protein
MWIRLQTADSSEIFTTEQRSLTLIKAGENQYLNEGQIELVSDPEVDSTWWTKATSQLLAEAEHFCRWPQEQVAKSVHCGLPPFSDELHASS